MPPKPLAEAGQRGVGGDVGVLTWGRGAEEGVGVGGGASRGRGRQRAGGERAEEGDGVGGEGRGRAETVARRKVASRW